jgi:competence ComEA-like helix-hairpin-helix protein
MYSKLQSFISIDTVALTETNSNEVKPQVATPVLVDINSADTLELVKLKGIGRSYARRIIAYRQLLGGFVRAEQLTEIWGFTPEMLHSIQSNIIIDSTQVQPININLVTFQDLKKHPYLTDYQAKAIIYYRETKGNIENLDEILKNKLVDAVTFKKIKGYMVVN